MQREVVLDKKLSSYSGELVKAIYGTHRCQGIYIRYSVGGKSHWRAVFK